MAKVDIKVTRNGPLQIRRSAGVLADLNRRARRIAAAAGPGMAAKSGQGKTRARASVVTATGEAIRAEANSRALTRAIDAGR